MWCLYNNTCINSFTCTCVYYNTPTCTCTWVFFMSLCLSILMVVLMSDKVIIN